MFVIFLSGLWDTTAILIWICDKWVKSLSPLTCLHQVTINPLGNITRKSRLKLPHIKIVLAKAPVLIGVKNALYFDCGTTSFPYFQHLQ
jgi:hypothetical protein